MKLSDYVAQFIARNGIRHVFAVSGGASLHLIHSVVKHPQLEITFPLHEQAAAMAADGYSRTTGIPGVAIATSGPGATNLLTGIACAYYDSVPALFITGQVASFRMKGDLGVRQIGFQETDIVSMCKPITKYAVRISRPEEIVAELEIAYNTATSGRMGPVLVDIPDDFQRVDIQFEKSAPNSINCGEMGSASIHSKLLEIKTLIEEAKRPVVIAGSGIRLAKAADELQKFIVQTQLPYAPTWGAVDLFKTEDPLNVGTFGTHGTRHGNFAVQNADLILSLGSRLDTKATGSPPSTFARAAKKIMVDIDPSEFNKFIDLKLDIALESDVNSVLSALNATNIEWSNPDWISKISDWKLKYPSCPDECFKEQLLNPYAFVSKFSDVCPKHAKLFLDTGCLLPWMMQGFRTSGHQRLFHDWNNTAMGWSLPASIGGYFASPSSPIFCLLGDGSLQMNIQELATVSHGELPIKIILFNNHGYSMIRQTQEQWFNSEHFASSPSGGLADPDYQAVFNAYGIPGISISKNEEIESGLKQLLNAKGSMLLELNLSPSHRVIPQVKFGRANEDSEPLLERDVFAQEMLIEIDANSQ